MKSFLASKCLVLAIIFLAIFFRFSDINWDQGNHLHPDERFLTMVGVAMQLPHSFTDYLNPAISTFNPANINFSFYVYGTLPVVITKILAMILGADNYMDFTILGRILSGLADLIVVYLVYKTFSLIEKPWHIDKNAKYWGAFFYAIAVLPIQLSHFFAVDTFLNVFCYASFYFVLKFYLQKNTTSLMLSALFFGLALGSKISALYISPLLFYFIINSSIPLIKHSKKATFYNSITRLLLFCFITYITMRIADPYLFQNGNDFFDPSINHLFLANLKSLQNWATPEAWFPPSVQWIHKTPVLFALTNLSIFGLGIGYTLLSFYGSIVTILKRKHWELIAILIWMLLFFIYESIQFSKTMRYFILLYPFIAIFAAIGFHTLTKHWLKIYKVIIIGIVLVWPMMFYSIYTVNHSRTQASKWIYQFIPNGSKLLSEHWDDALPIGVTPTYDKRYIIDELHVFDPDTEQKWITINSQLEKSDYLILSSNRGWGSMPTVPERYPIMKKFYSDLFANKTNYKKVAEFTSYPSLKYIGIPIVFPDDWSEEAFTVYDHPKVMIFKKQ